MENNNYPPRRDSYNRNLQGSRDNRSSRDTYSNNNHKLTEEQLKRMSRFGFEKNSSNHGSNSTPKVSPSETSTLWIFVMKCLSKSFEFDEQTATLKNLVIQFIQKIEKFDSLERIMVHKIYSSIQRNNFYSDSNAHLEYLDYLPERMKVGYISDGFVGECWLQKTRMDDIFDAKKSSYYYKAREELFPQDKHGSSKFNNRAGDKLSEIDDAIQLFDNIESGSNSVFLDLCGGPGAFSQLLLKRPRSKGYGFTLNTAMAGLDDISTLLWYPYLKSESRFIICEGQDKTGNIYLKENLEHLQNTIRNNNDQVDIVVGDGGFEINKIGDVHMENYQELYCGRILLSEFLMAIKVLKHNGHFVCKLFDNLTHLTQSLIYMLTQVFEETYLVKPVKSRLVNSERYVVGKFFKNNSPEEKSNVAHFIDTLSMLHQNFPDNKSPLSVVPVQFMKEDLGFVYSISVACQGLYRRQVSALKKVIDRTEKLISEENKITIEQIHKRERSHSDTKERDQKKFRY